MLTANPPNSSTTVQEENRVGNSEGPPKPSTESQTPSTSTSSSDQTQIPPVDQDQTSGSQYMDIDTDQTIGNELPEVEPKKVQYPLILDPPETIKQQTVSVVSESKENQQQETKIETFQKGYSLQKTDSDSNYKKQPTGVATSSSSIVSNEVFLKRTIYLWQERNQYSKVEVFDDRKRKLGEMEPIGQQFYVMRGNFDPYVHSVVLQMHVSKNVLNRFFTGNDIRPCMVMLGESRYSFAFDQNHTVGLVEYCRVISETGRNIYEKLESLLTSFVQSNKKLDLFYAVTCLKNLTQEDVNTRFIICTLLGLSDALFNLQFNDMKLIFNSLLAIPFNSEMKQYKTMSKCLGVILTRTAINPTPDFALRLLSSDYTEITGYEFVRFIHTNYLITNEGALSEIMENLIKKKQAILNSPSVGTVARFLLNSLPVRMSYLDFILELNPECSNSFEFKDKFKKAIGTESNIDKLFSIRENYPKLSLSVDIQLVSLILSEKVDLEDETELIRIQELIDQSEIKKEDKLKVLLSTMLQLTDNDKTLKFFITIANLKKFQNNELKDQLKKWLAARVTFGGVRVEDLTYYLHLCTVNLGKNFLDTVHEVILPRLEQKGTDESLLDFCLKTIINEPCALPIKFLDESVVEVIKITIKKLQSKKVPLYLYVIDGVCCGKEFNTSHLRTILLKILELMDTERVFKDNAWFLLIKYFTLKPEPKLLNITTKINFLKKNLAAVTVEKIENLNNNDHQILKLYLGEDCVKSLADMIQQINTYKEHINDMRKILDAYCTHCSDFEKMKKKYKDLYDGMMKMSFSEFQNQSVSGAENKNLKAIICCKQSKSFSKLLKARTSKHTSLVSDIIDLGSAISEELTHFSYELFLGENLPSSKVIEILGAIKKENITNEVKFLGNLVDASDEKVIELTTKLKTLLFTKQVMELVQKIIGITGSNALDIGDIDTEIDELNEFKNMSLESNWIETCKRVEQIISTYSLDRMDCLFLDALSTSSPLLQFIKETDQQSIMALVNAVEDLGENFIRQETVADLIEASKLIRPIISQEYRNIQDFCNRLSNIVVDLKLVVKVESSNHSINGLKNLLDSIANRGELTKETIYNATQSGYFRVSLENVTAYILSLLYKGNDDQVKQVSIADIQDLRSRALLIINSRKDQSLERNFHDMEMFIEYCDLAFDYLTKINNLKALGNNKDYCSEKIDFEALPDNIQEIETETQNWQTILDNYLGKHFFLNFFAPEQFWVLERYFSGNGTVDDVYPLLNFIHPISKNEIKLIQFQQQEQLLDMEHRLERLGKILDKIFHNKVKSDANVSSYFRNTFVVLSVENKELISTILKIFTNSLPKPSTVLFCEYGTTWQQLNAIVSRSFFNNLSGDLYCIAQIEKLSFSLQAQLVDKINRLKELNLEKKSSLCLIDTSGNQTSYVVNQFKRFLQNIPNTTTTKAIQPFSKAYLYSSDVSGVGKTENIRLEALRRRKKLVHLPIMDSVNRAELCNRLKRLNLSHIDCLHIDIRNLSQSNACLLNNLLFEIITFGMVIDDRVMFKIPVNNLDIFIELESQSRFWNFLTIRETYLINKKDIEFSLENLVFNKSLLSRSQVTFNYLKALDNDTIDTEDIIFSGPNANATVVSDEECRLLIQKYFFKNKKEINYSLMHVFINVLAEQFIKFSQSVFLKTQQITHVTESQKIRSKLVKVLMDVYSEFSTRSVHGNRKQQQHHVMGSKSDVVLFKESGMVRWEESNHLIVAFHKYDSTITALYRDLSFLQQTHSDIFDTLQSQKVSLPDYSSLNQEALLFELGKMAGSITEYDGQYAMTADNLLKMMLILLRVEACIPVVISGETGCGKTSLVEFLAKKTGASFNLLNFHAGTTPDIIISFMEAVIEQAYNNPNTKHLVFLDEINTCDYLGLVSEIVTLKSIRGISLPINISVIAACNPYRTRKHIYTSALEKDKASDLAYRVNPLPDCLIDYIWDYGFLSQTDEMSYIQTMLGRLTIQFPKHILCTIICESQAFVRDLEDASSVSLRDVNRFIVLCQYFLETLKKRSEPLKKANQIMWIQENQRDDKYDISSVVLALSVCYYSRLAKLEYRENYLTTVCKHLPRISKEDFVRIVDEEQTSYLRRMEIPPNIAWNRSLKENIFVILVCILNKLPVFVVGKPGCSKSLAIQLLTSNLRGEDSIDKYFKTLPQLIFIAFQGSESSTSEGILKVFDKARGYLKINEKEEKVIPVVILDEIGLAEISAHNPLKALHALLEPKKRDVAVVGISNWRLDAAKMNRAVHVSRPEADENELKEIAKTILFENNHIEKTDTIELLLDYLSKSYYEFISNKKYNNFHGLRDYYSLVKSVIIEEEENFAVSLCRAIDRNFGGLSASAMNFKKILFEKASITESVPSDLPILELIKENIEDKNARHLMLITNSDSALDIITYYYKEFLNRSPEIIYGSQFNLDKTEEYSYVVLNKIIYCMEEGYTLILKDLDSVYGSLYDMLNQNYTYVAKRRNCRIAIGPHSNPMCHVNENFRCIVLVDQKRLATCDPPFLNRFEKQILNFENISESKVNECVMRLNEWVENITNLDSNVFTVNDMFPSYSSDTLSSLVLANTNSTTSVEHCVEICKEALIATSTFDGIVRMAYSSVSKEECENWLNRYQLDKHNNLLDYYNNCDGFAHMIMTFSHILTELNFTWLSSIRVREFNTEREFAKKVEDFFNDEENGLLTIHFESHLDGKFVPMVKFIVDHQIQNSDRTDKKVFLILHISRDIYENANEDWKLNFMNGWKQVTIDELSPNFDQTNLLDIHDMFSSEFYNVESILKDIIQATLMKIDYFAVNIEYISTLSSKIIEDAEFLQFIGEILNEELQKVQFDWRKHVALDKKKLAESGCLIDAIKNEMQDLVQRKLLNILKFIEQHSALETFFIADPKLRALWKNITAKYHNNGANNSKIMLIKGLRLPYSKWQCEIYKELKDKLEMLKQNSSIEKGDNQEQQLEPLLLSLIESSECVFGLQDYSEELLKRDFLTITAQELGLNSEFAQIFENIILGLFEINLVLSPKERLILMVWNNQKTLLAVVELIKYCCGNSIEIPEDIECLDDLLDIITLSLLQDGTRTPNNEWKDKIATVLPILLEENVSATLLKILKDFSHYLLEYPYEIQQICTEILCYDCNLEDPKLIENILQILSKSQNLFQSKMVFISRLELTEELLEVVCRELVEIQDVKYLTQIVYKICVDHIEELEEGDFENLRVLNNLLVNNPYCPLYYVFIDVLEELVSDKELTNEEELRILGNKINSPNSESVPDIERAYYVASIRHHLKNISSQEDLQTTISGSIISNYLSQDEDAKNYLLKCVRQSFDNWLDFKEFVESDISGSLDVDLTNKSFDTLGYNIFRSLPRYKEAEKAFDEMYYLKNTRDMSKLIHEAKSNPKLLYTLMGLITNNIHFSQITDSKLRLCVEFFAGSFQSFSKSVKNLVTRLLRSATVRDCSYVIRISVMCLAVCIPENPISIFIKNPNTVRSTYVVTAEDDILGGILKAINTKDGGHSRYRCNCGYVYLIGNCGQPNGTARCPTCGATLGGEGHKLIQGSRIDEAKRDGTDSSNEKGCTMSAINDDYHTVRQFPPAMFRVWQFFINSIILNGLDINLVSIDEIRGFFIQNQLNNPIDYFNEKAAKDWNILAQILDQQGENLCFLLQQCIISNLDYLFGNNERLDTEDKRAIFENGLIEYTSRVLGDINLSIRDIKMNSTRSEENSSLQAIIEETCTPNNSQINKFTEFRITSSPSVQGMKALFMSNPENAQLYPFLKAYLTNEKELHHIESLFDLITFSNLLMDKCDNTIERATAEKTEMKYYAETNGLKELYGKVVTEWKAEKAVNYGCKQPKSKKRIDTEMLSFFLIEDQQEPFGLYICAALQGYAEVQNNFIDIAEQNAEKSANLAFLKSINGIIGLPTIPVQKAQKKDLVIINPEYLEDLTITFSYKNYEYGKGTTVGYLFDKIEFALASKYLLGKKRLDFENLRKIKYIGESFGSNADMAARKKIPNPIPLDDSERTKVNILINDLPRLKKIQGSLQKLLEVMNLVNFNPDVTVSTFCYDWKINLNDKEQFFANFTLNKIVNLFEYVEEVIFDFEVNYLSDLYTIELEENIVQRIIRSCQENNVNINNLTTVLKRFIIRFLIPAFYQQTNIGLNFYIIMDSLWPITSQNEIVAIEDGDIIPDSVCLCHTKSLCMSLIKHLAEQDRKVREAESFVKLEEYSAQPTLSFKKVEDKKKKPAQAGRRLKINA